MHRITRLLAAAAMLSSLVPQSASAAFLQHRFVVWNHTAHCFTVTIQQRGQSRPATFAPVKPEASFDHTTHSDKDVYDWFLEWTVWKCDANGNLSAPIYTGWVVDNKPMSISDYVVTPLGSGFQMARKN